MILLLLNARTVLRVDGHVGSHCQVARELSTINTRIEAAAAVRTRSLLGTGTAATGEEVANGVT